MALHAGRRHLAPRGADDAVRRELPPEQARAGPVRPRGAADHGGGRVAHRRRRLADRRRAARWTHKALRLLELPEAILARVERGDLSFTAADFVRRGIARGDVAAREGGGARGAARGGRALRPGAQVRRRLRPAATQELRRRSPPGWTPRGASGARARRASATTELGQSPGPSRAGPRIYAAAGDAELDGYVLGAFLYHSATARTQKLLRITGEADAHEYARSLRPHERLPALRYSPGKRSRTASRPRDASWRAPRRPRARSRRAHARAGSIAGADSRAGCSSRC